MTQKTGVERIADERRRQIEAEGWTPAHDDTHDSGEMAIAAACYAAFGTDAEVALIDGVVHGEGWRDAWPWDPSWDKRRKHTRLRSLEIAGALITAEIDRLLRRGST